MKKIALLIEEFNTSICEIEKSNHDILTALNKKIKLTNNCLQQFRAALRKDCFSSQKDEVEFFKHQKPYVQGRLEYYRRLKNFFVEKPKGRKSKQRKFINKELNLIDAEKCKYADFIKYYRLGKKELDNLFFLRGNEQFELFLDNSYYYDDPDFSTRHDYIVSKIITNDLLIKFYNQQLDLLDKKDSNIIVKQVKSPVLNDLAWTASKTELTELVISLIAFGAIKNGNVDMKKMVEGCKEIFGIDLGNIYNTYAQIRDRKKDPTKFLDKLKFSLIKKLETDL
jgi:hypothetical protein